MVVYISEYVTEINREFPPENTHVMGEENGSACETIVRAFTLMEFSLRLSIDSGEDNDVFSTYSPSSVRSTRTVSPQFSDTPELGAFVISKEDLVLEKWRETLSKSWRTLNESSQALEDETSLYRVAPALSRSRNRYKDVLPLRHSRVKLESAPEPALNKDYINASLILKDPKQYIATQAPLPDTFAEFWCMVWEQNVQLVAALCKVHDVYWPETDEIMRFPGDKTVQVTALSESEECVEREMILCYQGQEKKVVHLLYKTWKDHHAPDMRSFTPFFERFRQLQQGTILVHCSAGIGRSGTLIAADILVDQFYAGELLNPLAVVYELRQQRSGMVQTLVQFRFLYQLLSAYSLKVPLLSRRRSSRRPRPPSFEPSPLRKRSTASIT